jgi:hypothetical protein
MEHAYQLIIYVKVGIRTELVLNATEDIFQKKENVFIGNFKDHKI